MKKGDVGMTNRFSKKYGKKDELSSTCNPKKSYVKIPVST